jgi:hypothetical protein
MSNRRRWVLTSLSLAALRAWIAPAAGAPATPADWIIIAAGSFLTLKAPQGTRFEARSGADSFLGVFVGPGFALQLDYGAYSDPLTDQSRFTAYSAQSIHIDGKPATIVRATPAGHSADLGRFIGLHFPELGRTGRGSLSLTITAVVSDSRQEELVLRMFDSIQLTR